ncbi:MAG: hypothetical protein RIS35_2826 [Pseudomonadota bacterium]|jgi:hypothetical protein
MTAPTPSPPTEIERFTDRLRDCLRDGSFVSLTLGRPHGAEGSRKEAGDGPAQPGPGGPLKKLLARRVLLRGEDHLSLVWRHATRDITRNLPVAEAAEQLRPLIATQFHHAHLVTRSHDIQLAMNRKGRWGLRIGKLAPAPEAQPGMEPDAKADAQASAARQAGHDRPRQHALSLDTPFLAELGVTDRQHRLVPAMARKWRQINKFSEILGHAIAQSRLAGRDPAVPVRVLDFGAGKGYLTFAVHHLLEATGRRPEVVGVELREELAALCNDAVSRLGLLGLRFAAGDIAEFVFDGGDSFVRGRPPAPGAVADGRSATGSAVDIMIALHACDIATDIAMYQGVRAQAEIILCSPCCHKQLRPQMRAPAMLAPMLRHGIHMTEQAEMLTDSLRALLLQAQGYDTQVFEFISPEHTGKNRMVLAVRRASPLPAAQRDALLAQVAELKSLFGVSRQHLETLLMEDRLQGSIEADRTV